MSIPTEPFKKKTLMSLCEQGDEKVCKEYIQSYFYKNEESGGVYFLNVGELNRQNDANPQKQIWRFLSNQSVKENYLLRGHTIKKVRGNYIKITFKAQDWFLHYNVESFNIVHTFNAPPVDFEKQTINVMGMPLLTREKCGALEDLPDEAKEGAWFIADHIKNVWTSNNDDQYNFVIRWLAHIIVGGEKLQTALYLKSIQGTGKSMIITFLMRKLLGYTLTLQTLTNSMLQPDAFNSILDGKLLVNFNEIPKATHNKWSAMQSTLKNYITEKTFTCNEKYHKTESRLNTFNLIIDTNESPIQITENIRRYCILDVSASKVGDKSYFKQLVKATNSPDVAKAFFLYLCKIYDESRDFEGLYAPKTNTLHQGVLDGIHPILRVVKEEWLDQERDFHISVVQFRNYLKTELNGQVKNLSIANIKGYLKKVGITSRMGEGRKQVFQVDFQDLLSGFKHAYKALRNEDDPQDDISEIAQLRKRIQDQQEQLDAYKQRIEELELNQELDEPAKVKATVDKEQPTINEWIQNNPPKTKTKTLKSTLCKIDERKS